MKSKNWKTTLAGCAAILSVVSKLVSGHQPDVSDVSAIIAGVGLILAKDSNVTGGTSYQ